MRETYAIKSTPNDQFQNLRVYLLAENESEEHDPHWSTQNNRRTANGIYVFDPCMQQKETCNWRRPRPTDKPKLFPWQVVSIGTDVVLYYEVAHIVGS